MSEKILLIVLRSRYIPKVSSWRLVLFNIYRALCKQYIALCSYESWMERIIVAWNNLEAVAGIVYLRLKFGSQYGESMYKLYMPLAIRQTFFSSNFYKSTDRINFVNSLMSMYYTRAEIFGATTKYYEDIISQHLLKNVFD